MQRYTCSSLLTFLRGWGLYMCLVFFRFFVALQLQPGYLHPDELFQSVEVAAGDIYGVTVHRTWEFNVSNGGPLRSIAGILPVVHLPVWLFGRIANGNFTSSLQNQNFSGAEWINRLLLPTRFTAALFSVLVDALILMGSRDAAIRIPSRPPLSLLLYASATFGGFLFAGRTIVNSWETSTVSLFGILFMFTIRQLNRSPIRDHIFFPIAFAMCFQAVLSTWAIFLRPTYAVFIAPMAIFEIFMVLGTLSFMRSLVLSSVCILITAVIAKLCISIDTAYYLGLSFVSAFRLSLPESIIVPYRFFMYNTNSDHVVSHGRHPWYQHLLINMPLIFGPVIPIKSLFHLPLRSSSLMCIFWCTCVLPLLLFSLIPHQEARFLMPLVPFLLVLAERPLRSCLACKWRSKLRSSVLFTWIVQQIVLCFIFGHFHQAGLIRYFKSLPPWSAMESKCVNYVFFHTYMPPKFPFGVPSNALISEACNNVMDLKGASFKSLENTVEMYWRFSKLSESNSTLNLLFPGSLFPLPVTLSKYGKIESHRLYFGHLSFEDPPKWNRTLFESSNVWTHSSYWYSQLSLHQITLSFEL